MKKQLLSVALFCSLLSLLFVYSFRVQAVNKTWDGSTNGNWSEGTNWSGDTAPSNGDALIFPEPASNKTTNNDLAEGTTFSGITVSGAGYTLGGNNIVLADSGVFIGGSGDLVISGSLSALSDFNAANITFPAGTLYLGGDLSLGSSAAGINANGGTIDFNGSGTQTVTFGDSMAISFSNIIHSGSGSLVMGGGSEYLEPGNISNTNGILDFGGATIYASSVTNDATMKLAGAESAIPVPTLGASSLVQFYGTFGPYNLPDWAYANLEFSSGSATTYNLSAETTITGDLTIGSNNTLDTTASNFALNVAGDWTNNGTFTANSGTVTLNGINQTISGATTFNNLTKTDSTNDSTDRILTFPANATTTVSGLLTITGTDSDDRVNLISSTPGTYWGLTANGTFSINYADVADSDASLGNLVTFTNTVNGGHNLNWDFNATPTVDTLGPAGLVNGSWTTDNTPTLTFTTADTDADNVAYEITVDNNSDFSSPIYQATSTYAAPGAVSTTTGVLADASYYWQVLVGDGNATSSYSTANGGGVAFKVDATAPTASITDPTDSSYATSSVAISANASDGGSGVAGVQFKLDTNTNIGAESVGLPHAVSWDSTAVADGSHTLIAVARDTAGNYATSTAITVTVDNTEPTLAEVTPVTTPTTDTTPSYTFSSDQAGTATYGGSCTSATTLITSSNNTINFSTLADGTYADCTITVTDEAGNPSSALTVTSFTINTSVPASPSEVSSPAVSRSSGILVQTNLAQNLFQTNNIPPESINHYSSIANATKQQEIFHSFFARLLPLFLPGDFSSWILTPKTTFTKSLKLRDRDPEIRQLQIFLNTHGFIIAKTGPGSPGKETDLFGYWTKEALGQFQLKNGLVSSKNDPNYGVFGPKTRTLINSLAF